MAFPELSLRSGGRLTSEATGTPSNGNNTFAHAIPYPIDSTWLEIEVVANGTSIRACTFVSADDTNLTLNFDQRGVATVTVRVRYRHSQTR